MHKNRHDQPRNRWLTRLSIYSLFGFSLVFGAFTYKQEEIQKEDPAAFLLANPKYLDITVYYDTKNSPNFALVLLVLNRALQECQEQIGLIATIKNIEGIENLTLEPKRNSVIELEPTTEAYKVALIKKIRANCLNQPKGLALIITNQYINQKQFIFDPKRLEMVSQDFIVAGWCSKDSSIIAINDFNRFFWRESGNEVLNNVACHEIGHLLGLNHSELKNSVMNARVTPYNQKWTEDDLNNLASNRKQELGTVAVLSLP